MSNRRTKKQLSWWIRQRRDLMSASAFHATSEAEASDIRSRELTQPIAIIPNGIAIPKQSSFHRDDSDERRILFLSRFHPVKGVLNLVHAFHRTCAENEWKLVLAGPGEGAYRTEVASLVNQLGLANRVSILGSISDAEKWSLYRTAEVFVLPSFSENFGIVVAEALAAGVPVITTTATPWSGLKERNSGWWVKPTADAVAIALRRAVSLPRQELQEMGTRGSQWVRSEFQWDSIASRMSQFYEWLRHGGSAPKFVV